ncbi:uncharacterized protein LOC118200221 [Stegodyphus dumicola]|uniref:uncharacterized protein LOC118200221 n=1 Tax=Stegodyphus dumicola TaxID=202533 RepID=UPI0015B30B78|nr:uncharacterized protein LOC118200221 [Stegodyphus dumicola]
MRSLQSNTFGDCDILKCRLLCTRVEKIHRSTRPCPTVIYSDNGTNFIGVSGALNQIEWQKIAALETLNPINWKFIPPTAAWWGGWWERLIRIVKNLLVRVLDVKETGTANLHHLDRKKLVKRESYCQELREQFRQQFRKEYLGQLVQKAGTSDKIFKVGEVVLVGSENQKRLNRPLAVIEELYPGRDGHVRVVKVKTPLGHLIRPVQKIYPLEVNSSGDPVIPDKHPTNDTPAASQNDILIQKDVSTAPRTSRSGRVIKIPKRLAY